jgi:hypothetical protein
LIDLYNVVDATIDPEASNKYVVHVKGPIQDDPPKVSNKISNKLRRWMIDKQWLEKEENMKYDTKHRIIENGKAWGEVEDPEVLIEKREKIKQEKKKIHEGNKRKARSALTKSHAKKTKHSDKGKGKAQASDAGSETD